jgi:hypothetical protein
MCIAETNDHHQQWPLETDTARYYLGRTSKWPRQEAAKSQELTKS